MNAAAPISFMILGLSNDESFSSRSHLVSFKIFHRKLPLRRSMSTSKPHDRLPHYGYSIKGAFKNYVDLFLPNFAHLPTHVDICWHLSSYLPYVNLDIWNTTSHNWYIQIRSNETVTWPVYDVKWVLFKMSFCPLKMLACPWPLQCSIPHKRAFNWVTKWHSTSRGIRTTKLWQFWWPLR